MLSTLMSWFPALGPMEVVIGILAGLVIRHYYKTAGFWGRKGIPDVPGLPIVGSSPQFYFQTEYRGICMKRFYDAARAKGEPCLGLYIGSEPVLLLTNLDMVRAIMVKDFTYFMDRGMPYDRKREPLTASLFNIEGNEWRSIRHKLTPTFTSGRMRAMFPLVQVCAEEMSRVLAEESAGGKPIEMFELLARFTTDVIGTCAFGIQANALKDPEAEFRVMGRKAFELSLIQIFFFLVAPGFFPLARKLLGVRLFDKDVSNFFTRVVEENFEFRQRSNVLRHDFVDLLLQLKNKGTLDGDDKTEAPGKIDEDILPAQAFGFFLAGFETSASSMANAITELAFNPDVQEKARAEVKRVLAKHNGKIDYESLSELVYLEQVIEESMRLYPALGTLDRVVTEEYTLPISSKNGKPPVLEKGMKVIIPSFAIHRDPEFYPNPDKFDPENFSADAKKNRPHHTYIPFGEGPRICIGLRFAMMQMKSGLATILRGFQVCPDEDSEYPQRFEPRTFVTKTYGGNKVILKPL